MPAHRTEEHYLKDVIRENKDKAREQTRMQRFIEARDEVIKIAAYGATADDTDEINKRRFEKIWRLMASLT